jgi:hypothetical protein
MDRVLVGVSFAVLLVAMPARSASVAQKPDEPTQKILLAQTFNGQWGPGNPAPGSPGTTTRYGWGSGSGYGWGTPMYGQYPAGGVYPYGGGYTYAPGYMTPAGPGVTVIGPGYVVGPGTTVRYPPAAYVTPMPVPVPVAGGMFRIGGRGMQYWLSPSGYYYPWCGTPGYGYPYSTTVYYVEQGSTVAAKPPVFAQFSDMEKFLDEQKNKEKIGQADYDHLSRRLHDLRSKFHGLSAAGGGSLDPVDEDNMRRDLDMLGGEMARALH